MTTILPSINEVAQSIDHAILKPNLSREEINSELIKADELNVFSVCVRPCDVEYAVQFLTARNSKVAVGTVIGFPHGSTTTAVKAVESLEAIDNGATEIDIVVNISMVIDGRYDDAAREIFEIVTVAREAGVSIVKVIFENAYLTPEQIENLTQAMQFSGADFVKTSTGFAATGAVVNDVAIMHYNRGEMEVKASGGIKDLDTYLKFQEIGATRFGTSNADIILEDLASRLTSGEATGKEGGSY
jgi:deoxyribose-phosphate aldolase